MQKKIVALAVAGLSTAAFAQTNVTIYGVADVSAEGYSMSSGKGLPQGASAVSTTNPGHVAQGNAFALQSNSSLIGFKGTEDLGNGLKAMFQIETGINLTGGGGDGVTTQTSNAIFGGARDSFVGLNSKYGTAMAGYLSTPYRSTLTSFDVLPGATGNGRAEQMVGTMRFSQQSMGLNPSAGSVEAASSVRATAIAYAMPTLYGFNGSIAYTGSNNNGQGNHSTASTLTDVNSTQAAPLQSAMSFNLGWTGYGVNVAGAFSQASLKLADTTAGATATSLNNFTSYLIGTSYTGIAGLKLSALYNRNTLGVNALSGNLIAPAGSQKLSNNQVYLGASYRMGNWEPRLAYTMTSDTDGSSAGQMGARQWVLNTGYYLSKRTQVYGLVSNLNNSANQNYFAGLQSSDMRPTGGQNMFTYGMGVRTTF